MAHSTQPPHCGKIPAPLAANDNKTLPQLAPHCSLELPRRVRMVRRVVAALACGSLALLGAAHAGEPWLAPGDQSLRHDLLVLADAGLLRGPQTTWPISWPDVARDLAAEPGPGALEPAVEQARARLLRAARMAADDGYSGVQFSVAGSSDPMPLRGYSATPREEGELAGGVSWLGDRFAASLKAQIVSNSADGQDLRLDGSYLAATIGNVSISAGGQERWWGPGWDGSLILGSNARPMPSVAIERKYADASRWPVLRWFGPWRASVVFGQAEGSRVAVPDTRFFGARVAFKPRPWMELGLSRTAQWCGAGRPCGISTFRDLLLGRDNRDASLTINDEPGNQMAGYDLRMRSPWRRLPLALYGQFIGEDEAGGLPSKFMGLAGAETWGGSGRYGSWRARFEYADTACNFTRSNPQFGCGFRNNLYPQGYSYRGRMLAHALDNDGRMSSLAGLWVLPSGTTWSLIARDIKANRDGVRDPSHRVSPAGASALRNLELQFDSSWRGTAVSLGVGYDDYSRPATAGSDVRGFVRVSRGL